MIDYVKTGFCNDGSQLQLLPSNSNASAYSFRQRLRVYFLLKREPVFFLLFVRLFQAQSSLTFLSTKIYTNRSLEMVFHIHFLTEGWSSRTITTKYVKLKRKNKISCITPSIISCLWCLSNVCLFVWNVIHPLNFISTMWAIFLIRLHQ